MEIRVNAPISHSANIGFGFAFCVEESINKIENKGFWGTLFKTITPRFGDKKHKQDFDDTIAICEFIKNTHETNLLNGLVIQINRPTKFSKLMTKVGLFLETKFMEMGRKIQCAYSDSVALAFCNENTGLIVLGFDILDKDKLTATFKNKISRQDTLAFIMFHEFSHCFEIKHDLTNNYDEKHLGFKKILKLLTNYSQEDVLKLNVELIRNGFNISFNKDDMLNIADINSAYIESYADVGAILLYKNYLIHRNEYNPDRFKSFIQAVVEGRSEIFKTQQHGKSIGYATFLAIEKLFDKNLMQEVDILSAHSMPQDLIHQIASLASIQSVSEILSIKMQTQEKVVRLISKVSQFYSIPNSHNDFNIGQPNLVMIKKIDDLTSENFINNKGRYKKLFLS